MRHSSKLLALMATLSFAFAGCENHQAKVDALQKEYDRLGEQYRKDCSEELLKVPPTLSPKCEDENKKVGEAWNQLQSERTKH